MKEAGGAPAEMSRKRNVFKCHVRFTTLVPPICPQSPPNLPCFSLFMGIFYCVFSADSGLRGKAEIHGVTLRYKFMIVNGKGEPSFSYYSVLSSGWSCGVAMSMLRYLNKSLCI